jgi:antitoxin MazE
MLTNLTRTGDSCGISIPAELLEQVGLEDAVELLAEQGRLVIRPVRAVRRQWESALAALLECMEEAGALGEVPDLPPVSV